MCNVAEYKGHNALLTAAKIYIPSTCMNMAAQSKSPQKLAGKCVFMCPVAERLRYDGHHIEIKVERSVYIWDLPV